MNWAFLRIAGVSIELFAAQNCWEPNPLPRANRDATQLCFIVESVT